MIFFGHQTRRKLDSGAWAKTLVVLATTAVILLSGGCGSGWPGDSAAPDAWLEIKGRRVSVEIADSTAEQAKGLGGRDALAWDHGMYFKYATPGFYGFWMKGMRFSIDIVWLRDGRIVGFETNIPFEKGGNGPTVRPRELVDAVLEVPANYSAASGWEVGDRVDFEDLRGN